MRLRWSAAHAVYAQMLPVLLAWCFLVRESRASSGQKALLVSGSARAELREDVSRTDQKMKLTEEARMNALQQAFGTSLMAAEKLELASVRSTDKEWNSKKFDRTVASVCRGLWISDVAEPAFAEMRDDQGRTILQVSVRGYATDAMENKVATQAFAGSCSDPSCYSRIYDEGERLFLRFMAGEDGYLFVILEDPQEQSAFFLQSGSAAPARVTANSELRIPDARSDDYYQDIQLTLNSAHTNKRQYLWYVYSTRAPVLPMLNSQPGAVPVLDNSIFHSWLLRTMTRDDSVQVIWTPITINPAPSNE